MFDKKRADDLIKRIQECDDEINVIEAQKNAFQKELNEVIANDIRIAMDGKPYGCGTAHIDCDQFEIKCTIGKTVKWDQSKLQQLWHDIQKSGEEPSQYIKIEYKVSEDAYKNWPSSIADVFEPARNVIAGKPKLEFKERK